jgi:hypothetical protein
MLEAAFAAWLVALFGDRFVKGTGRLLLGSPEERRLSKAMAKATEVAIGALLMQLPAESRDPLGAALCERFSVACVVVLDGHTRVRDALVAAVREQIAPLGNPANTTSQISFLEEISIDEACLAEDLAEIAIRSIEQLAPSHPELAPLAAQLNADSAVGRDEVLAIKVNAALSMLERLLQTSTGAGDYSGNYRVKRQFAEDALDRIVDLVLDTQSFRDDTSRNEVLFSLPEPLRSAVPRSSRPRIQAYRLVQTCGSYPNGLSDLMSVLRSFERDSLEMRNLDSMLLGIEPILGDDRGRAR